VETLVLLTTGKAPVAPKQTTSKPAGKPRLSPKKRAAASERMKAAWAERKRKAAEAGSTGSEAGAA